VGATTLPLKVFSMVKFGVSPEINVISVFMLLMAVLLLIVFQRVQRVPGTVKIKSTAEAEDQ